MHKIKSIFFYTSSIIVLILLSGCNTIGVDSGGESYAKSIMFENQLSQSGLTLDAKNFLTTNALELQYQESPETVIKLCLQEINKKNSDVILEHNYRSTLKVIIELCINEARNSSETETIKYWMTSCYLSYRYLYDVEILPPLSKLTTPDTGTIEKYYNFTLYKIFCYLKENYLIHTESFELDIVGGKVRFNKPVSTMPWPLDAFKTFLLCYNYQPKGFNETIFQLGAGLPLCGIPYPNDRFQNITDEIKIIKYLYPCNFALEFEDIQSKGNNFEVTPYYLDFYKSIFVNLDKNKVKLSNNYTTILAKFLEAYPQDTEAEYFFDPGSMIDDNVDGVYMLTPFDKDKIPVLFIHGLISDPQSLAQITNTLMQSNPIRENYQFWYYFYPTGQTILLDAFTLRTILDTMNKKYNSDGKTKYDKMIVVGYSLGGLVAQLLIQGSGGDFLEKQVFFTELKKLEINKEHKKLVKQMLNFKPLPYIKETIFISTPHRGAEMAAWVSSQIMGDLVVSPSEYYQQYKQTLMFMSQFTRDYNGKIISGNALDNLSPNSPFIKLTQELPYSKDVIIHSIIGNINSAGKLGGTDGVVPYSSSHLDNAASETIIKSDHHAIYKPACAKEIYRILIEYLKKNNEQL